MQEGRIGPMGFGEKALLVMLIAFASSPAAQAQQCVGDANANNAVTIDELVMAVNNALEGCVATTGRVAVSGSVAATPNGLFRVWAVSETGEIYATETAAGTGRFTLLVPPGDWYVMGFGHYDNPGAMHFTGHMVFPCHGVEDDHFFVSATNPNVDLGSIVFDDDGSFAFPEHGPLHQMDHDADGIPDSDDSDIDCEDVGDHNGDGYYDDDVDHDGYHDDDFDHDGHVDGSHHGGHGPGHMGH